jgi:hypothetical protein
MFKNSRKAYQIYRKLTDEEKEILESRKISGKHSIREWNRKLSHIAIMDAYADKARGGLKGILIVSLFLTFFVAMFMINAPLFFLILVIVVGVSIFLTAMFFYGKLRNIDVGNQLRYFLIPTLKLLGRKVRKSHKVDLDIDLNLPIDEQYKTDQEVDSQPADVRFRKVTHTYYRLPWLQAKVPLADGSLLVWENEDLVRERKVIKKHKSKRKTKIKTKHLVKVKLMLPKSRYQLLEGSNDAIRVDEAAKFYILSFKGKEQSAYNPNNLADEHKSINPKYFASLLIQAYEQVEPIKPQTA